MTMARVDRVENIEQLGHEADMLWGIERHPQSPAKGQLVVPVIFLWNRPPVLDDMRVSADGVVTLVRGERHVIAVAEHGTEVRLIEKLEAIDGRCYYHVEVAREASQWVGRARSFIGWLTRRKVTGWIPLTMLKRSGAGWWRQAWAN